MDVAADFTMCIWMDAVDVATVGVGIEFTDTDVVGVVGKGWTITLALCTFFLQVLWFSSSYQPFWILVPFLVDGLHYFEEGLHWCMVVIKVWGWGQGFETKLVLQF